jgi:DNA polymerase III subunit alpha
METVQETPRPKLSDLSAKQAEEMFPGPSEFVHLHNHTIFSMLDGVAQPEQYFKGCAERKWPAFAVTEHGTLNSIPDNYLAAKEYKVKYITGCEFYYNDYELMRQKLSADGMKAAQFKTENPELASRMFRNRHLTVLAKNMTGYHNLLTINKIAWEKGFYYRPRMWLDTLAAHKEGLIVLSGCLNGPVSHELRVGNFSTKDPIVGALDYVSRFKEVFGEDYYIELQMPGIPGDVEVFRQLVAIADSKKIKTVLANDCHYIERKDFVLQKIMMAIDQDTTIDDPELFHVNSDEQYFKTRHELRATFNINGYSTHVPSSAFETMCNNTLEIADKCETFKPNLEPKLPKIDDAEAELTRIAFMRLKELGLHRDEKKYLVDGREVTYKEQMMIEIQRFIEKGFASYFLITRDLIQSSLTKGWPIGPARGSAGGSLVCFLLKIHSLDPIKWGLSFDRFLSPSRGGYMLNINMPKLEKK